MIEEEVKRATCQVMAGTRSGTGWLVSPRHVLTALHTIEDPEGRAAEHVTVRFCGDDVGQVLEASVIGRDSALDVCLLLLQEPVSQRPLDIGTEPVRPGSSWYAFGFPGAKLDLGHRAQGTVQQVLQSPIHGVELDLSVDPETVLSKFNGLSGAALIVDDVCQGIIRISLDNSLGALDIARIRDFLTNHELAAPVTQGPPTTIDQEPGKRPKFDVEFTDALRVEGRSYVLLEGAHGIGKSTYCRTFSAEADDIEVLGVYAFTDSGQGATPAHQAQPEIFFDWLHSLSAMRSSGRPARLVNLSYAQMIERSKRALEQLAGDCRQKGKQGVLFIDGVNEAGKVGPGTLECFTGLLPPVLPKGLKIVLTGVGLASLAEKLGDVARGATSLRLPALSKEAQIDVCLERLEAAKATPKLVDLLCSRALGHPLYLRYLIDLVNDGADEEQLVNLPAFSGTIEDYYDTIWAQLVLDSDVVNLLAIIARLRWGVATDALMPLLTGSERAVYIATLVRIRHLLTSPEETAIYHPSFSEFVVHRTSTVGQWVQERLAAFCADSASGEYGVLNRIYHGLRGDLESSMEAIRVCDQQWVDAAVLNDANPDLLLSDVESALAAATKQGKAVDIVRLLLLSQRVRYRYDTLFAQHAALVAEALIALGKPDQAMRHILRYGLLIVDPNQAFALTLRLTKAGRADHALSILLTVGGLLERDFYGQELKWSEYTHLTKLRIHIGVLVEKAGASSQKGLMLKEFRHTLVDPDSGVPFEHQQSMMQDVSIDMLGALLCLNDEYTPIAEVPIMEEIPNGAVAKLLIDVATAVQRYSLAYGLAAPIGALRSLFADINVKLDDTLGADDKDISALDALIELGAPAPLISRYSSGMELGAAAIPLFTKSRALPDAEALEEGYRLQRAIYVTGNQLTPLVASIPGISNWEAYLEMLVRTLAWFDGGARRAHSSSDAYGLAAIKEDLELNFLPALKFTFESRIRWPNSYFIPEHVMPWLYQRLAKLYLDCFDGDGERLLSFMKESVPLQLGLYNEGFRKALANVIQTFASRQLPSPVEDANFELLMAWRSYALENVENRQELVPELLQIVSLLAHCGSLEVATRTYESVLAVSMGPGWYKEDQLSVMSECLSALPAQTAITPSELSQIAAYLERATGEMTFRRYVRADKGSFIGQLCRRGLSIDAVRYFQHQACGTTQQLFGQVSEGNLDRVSPFEGMRFPGAALEEQAALLNFLKNLDDNIDEWRIKWALLEAYQNGDDRHLSDWGAAYAVIIKALASCPTEQAWAYARIRTISESLNREKAWPLLHAARSELGPQAEKVLGALIEEVENGLSADQLDRISSSFGIRRGTDPTLASLSSALPGSGIKGGSASASVADRESAEEDQDDRALLPGRFGRRSAIEICKSAIKASRDQMKRHNTGAAIEHGLAALQALQQADWSIWDSRHAGSEADQLLGDLLPDGNMLARAYGALATEERNVERWRIASRLIELSATKVGLADQTELLRTAIDHVGHMVGQAPMNRFTYIGRSIDIGGIPAALELLLWLVDHPDQTRSDVAASMISWVLRSEDRWIGPLVRLAASNDSRRGADVVTCVLDLLSHEDPVKLWNRIKPHLNVDDLAESLVHVSRFVTFLRIATRAGDLGDSVAKTFSHRMRAQLQAGSPSSSRSSPIDPPEFLSPMLEDIWLELGDSGLMDPDALHGFSVELEALCQPLTIAECLKLEYMVADARGRDQFSLDRWETKLLHALNLALFPGLSEDRAVTIEALLRTCWTSGYDHLQ